MIINGNRIKAEDGYKLYKSSNGVIAKSVFLGKYSSPNDWKEIPNDEAEAIEKEQKSKRNLESIR